VTDRFLSSGYGLLPVQPISQYISVQTLCSEALLDAPIIHLLQCIINCKINFFYSASKTVLACPFMIKSLMDCVLHLLRRAYMWALNTCLFARKIMNVGMHQYFLLYFSLPFTGRNLMSTFLVTAFVFF
jgi:hypothetical protein